MFDLEYKGGNSLIVSTKNTTAVIDGKASVVGLKDLKTKDVVEIATEPRFVVGAGDSKVVICGAGEYEVGDLTIRGVAAQRYIDTENDEKIATVYRLESGDIRAAVIGNIHGVLDDDQLEAIGLIDILVIPVGGGGYTLDATDAATIVRQLEPKIVVPVHYRDSVLKYEVPQEELELFVKELGAPVEVVPKLKMKSGSTLPAATTIYQVTRS